MSLLETLTIIKDPCDLSRQRLRLRYFAHGADLHIIFVKVFNLFLDNISNHKIRKPTKEH